MNKAWAMDKLTGRWAVWLQLALAVLIVAVVSGRVAWRAFPPQPGDQPRYAAMGLNLADHGVLSGDKPMPGQRPVPGNGVGGPMIALELAFAAKLSAKTRAGLVCVVEQPKVIDSCGPALGGLRLLHIAEIVVFLAALWAISYRLFGARRWAWLSVLIALLMREVTEYAALIMTEPLYLMLYGLLALGLLVAWQREARTGPWLLAGALLGLTALSKPAVLPLAFLLPVLAYLAARRSRQPVATIGTAMAAPLAAWAGVCLVVGPMMVRNWVVTGSPGMTDAGYLEAALSHRVAYNAMSWGEWARGWIYYLPDFGDNLSYALFGKANVEKLGWGPAGYYVWGRDVLQAQVHAVTAPAYATSLLIKTYVLGDFIKHAAVSALLFWRGIFVGGYVGMLAIPVLVVALLRANPEVRQAMAVVVVPALAIAAINAGASVSITRYNVALVPGYALALTWAVQVLTARFAGRAVSG
jgi:Dolichyl-phosphate-mannose-protein mannosyltransferase